MTGLWGRPRVGVSSCLLGEEVRFNGGHKRYRFLTNLVARIDAYRRGEEPLSVPIGLLAHYASGLPWLAEQTYLKPFPPDLRLRHSRAGGRGMKPLVRAT